MRGIYLGAALLAGLLPLACGAQLKLMIAVDPSDAQSGFVTVDEVFSGLVKASGGPVHALRTENLGDAMRSTRTGEYDIYIAPAHVAASALSHGYDLIGTTRPLQPYVFVIRANVGGLADLKGRKLYLSQQDSVAAYLAKGMLNEAGQSLRAFKEVMYRKTTGAGLFAVGVGTVDATVALEDEAQQWLKANPGKAAMLLRSQPVPVGMTVLVKASLPAPVKSKVAAWFTGPATVVPGIGKIHATQEAGPYKYVASLGHFTPAQLPGAKRVDANAVKTLVAGDAQMIDVRSAKEYVEAHIPVAVNVPYIEKSLKDIAFDAAVDSFAGLEKLDKGKPVVFACNGAECWKSYKASKWALARGFTNVHWFRGGLPEWRNEGLPVDRAPR